MLIKKLFIISAIAILGLTVAVAGEPRPADQIPAYLQDISVTIHSNTSQGSGVVKIRDGVTYILTCGHVVDDLRHERVIIDPKTGGTRTKIEFDDAKIVKEIYEDGRSVGEIKLNAEVLRYSEAENGEDLALLRVRKRGGFLKESVVFSTDSELPIPVGTKLLHVGSLHGQTGSNSLTTGIVSQHGRVRNNMVFDQSTCSAFPGSSGGGLFRESDGQYVGMVVRGGGETFNLYVPMRRILAWTDRAGVRFVIDDKVAVPDDATLKKIPIEEVSGENPLKDRSAAIPKKSTIKFDREFPLLPVKNVE